MPTAMSMLSVLAVHCKESAETYELPADLSPTAETEFETVSSPENIPDTQIIDEASTDDLHPPSSDTGTDSITNTPPDSALDSDMDETSSRPSDTDTTVPSNQETETDTGTTAPSDPDTEAPETSPTLSDTSTTTVSDSGIGVDTNTTQVQDTADIPSTADSASVTDLPVTADSESATDLPSTDPVECAAAQDCVNTNACSGSQCIEGTCVYPIIPGCVCERTTIDLTAGIDLAASSVQITEDAPDNNSTNLQALSVDTQRIFGINHTQTQVLLRFALPASVFDTNLAVDAAGLSLYSTDASSGRISLYRMMRNWDESSTWNSVENGITPDDIEAPRQPEAVIDAPEKDTRVSFDVTSSVVQFMKNPNDNNGWVLISDSTDGWDFSTGYTPESTRRPVLHLEGEKCRVVSAKTVKLVFNPYAAVDWVSFGRYKANFHTHTDNSSDVFDVLYTPEAVINDYRDNHYEVLAITDHNHTTWPWTDYGADPDALGMVAVKGNEFSEGEHINALWDFSLSSATLETGIAHVESQGGLTQINHPGRQRTPAEFDGYLTWLSDYRSIVSLEVINQGDRYPYDRELWDAINEVLFEETGRFVFGASNDDSHNTSQLFRNYNFLLAPALTDDAVRTAQETGASYFSYESGGTGRALAPRIESIDVDETGKTITVTADDFVAIHWIGPGTSVVGTGEVFNYAGYTDCPFVRIVIEGVSGDTYSQPFGFETVSQ